MFKYLNWLFPDAVECFYPAVKENRQFRWPGLGVALWCLFMETLCFLTASTLLTLMTLGYGLFLVSGFLRDSVTSGLPPASGRKKGETFPVTKLDASKDQVVPRIIQDFISRSEPVIIKNLPKETFSALAPGGQYAPALCEAMVNRGTVIATTYYFPRDLGAFGEWIQKNVRKPVLYMLRLAGSYGSTAAHMDGFSAQVYYVAKERKRVWVCPRQYHHLLDFQSGYNSVFIPGSGRSCSQPREWMKSVPGVWSTELEAGDVFIFNNSGNLHQFENITKDPEVFSLRVPNMDMSPVLARHHLCNWDQARYFSKLLLKDRNKIVEVVPVEEKDPIPVIEDTVHRVLDVLD